MKVLIIEDNQAIAGAFRRIIETSGSTTILAKTPSSALEQLASSAFNLLLVDLMLPEMDGTELIEKIRNLGYKTPIVVTTNMGSGYDEERLLSLDVSEIILKISIGPEELIDIVEKYAQ